MRVNRALCFISFGKDFRKSASKTMAGGHHHQQKSYSVQICLCIKLCTQEKKVPAVHTASWEHLISERNNESWRKRFFGLFMFRMEMAT